MKGKRIFAAFLSTVLIAGVMSGCGGNASSSGSEKAAGSSGSSSLSGKLTIWDWDKDAESEFTAYYKKSHPDVTFETMVVANTDYMEKFQSALASGSGVPDVVLTEMGYRGRLFDMGVLEDLSAAPYNISKDDMFTFAWELGSNSKGKLLGVEQQICPTGLAYRRDLAKKYLGTDDPDEIAKLIPDWDSFIKVGNDVKQASNGKCYIFPAIDAMINALRYQSPSSYIDGDSINITDRYSEMLDTACKMNQAGMLGNMTDQSPALAASYSAGSVLFYECAPWSMKWTFMANDSKDTWGLTKLPGESGTTYGGTSISIYSGSKNKDLAWDYIKYTYCTGDGVKNAYEKFGFMSGFSSLYSDDSYYFTEKGAYDDLFGGQNMSKYFINNISLKLNGQVQTKNESYVSTALTAVTAELVKNKSTASADAIAMLKKELQTLVPEATIK
jgi:multiple sugar transport system substrate-binding protein